MSLQDLEKLNKDQDYSNHWDLIHPGDKVNLGPPPKLSLDFNQLDQFRAAHYGNNR
jgi:hypothetical protein